MSFTPDGETFITVGDDKNIRFWPALPKDDEDIEEEVTAKHSIVTKVRVLHFSVCFLRLPKLLSYVISHY